MDIGKDSDDSKLFKKLPVKRRTSHEEIVSDDSSDEEPVRNTRSAITLTPLERERARTSCGSTRPNDSGLERLSGTLSQLSLIQEDELDEHRTPSAPPHAITLFATSPISPRKPIPIRADAASQQENLTPR